MCTVESADTKVDDARTQRAGVNRRAGHPGLRDAEGNDAKDSRVVIMELLVGMAGLSRGGRGVVAGRSPGGSVRVFADL